ncbi:hypothetical protein FWF48_02680 [Candidatus Saccharibacteria bacterium]|nr:hypothetical protein [Candidatus Saccharibacteria bacterium]
MKKPEMEPAQEVTEYADSHFAEHGLNPDSMQEAQNMVKSVFPNQGEGPFAEKYASEEAQGALDESIDKAARASTRKIGRKLTDAADDFVKSAMPEKADLKSAESTTRYWSPDGVDLTDLTPEDRHQYMLDYRDRIGK